MSTAAHDAPAAETSPVQSPMMKHLAGRLPAAAMTVLQSKSAAPESDKPKEDKLEIPAGKADDKGAVTDDGKGGAATVGGADDATIDLGELSKGEGGEEDKSETPEELNKLDVEQLKKRLEDKNKENTKVRKRAQEAEASVKQLTSDLEKARASQTSAPVAAGVPLSGVSGEHLDNLAKDVANVLAILKASAKNPDASTKYKSLTDGQNYDVTPDMLDWALQTQEDIQIRREFLKNEASAQGEADKISKQLDKVPGYKEALAILRQDTNFLANRPLLEADAALGRLAREGGYVLVKKDKAAAATSAAAPGQERQKEAAKPSPELPSTMPPVARTDGGDKPDVSAAQKRAMTTGSRQDIKAMMIAKAKNRSAAP